MYLFLPWPWITYNCGVQSCHHIHNIYCTFFIFSTLTSNYNIFLSNSDLVRNCVLSPTHNESSAVGHNRHGPKMGRGCCGGLGPHLTQCGLGRGLPLHQVASWSIQPFGHNCKNATLRVGIRLRTIFIPGFVIKTFTGCMHWVIARYQLNSSK